ncbi:hypothetical protein T08_1697 [Trichinella sp. T8]|nr:hypothetical protein T08_1697 [Trichinella sp. T8]
MFGINKMPNVMYFDTMRSKYVQKERRVTNYSSFHVTSVRALMCFRAYQQLTVDDATADAQTIITHRGAFRVKHLQFGILEYFKMSLIKPSLAFKECCHTSTTSSL